MKKERVALLEAMMMAILQIQIIANSGENEGLSKEDSELIADLADTIHNIPPALAKADFDIEFQVNIMLKRFDDKYPNYEGVNPYKCYQNSLVGEGILM